MPKRDLRAERTLFDALDGPATTNGHGDGPEAKDTTSTFSDNLALAVHRWFRYSAGFSAPWVREVIEREKKRGRSRVLDPFAGSGTVARGGCVPAKLSTPAAPGPGRHNLMPALPG